MSCVDTLTPRQRVELALRGGHGPSVPFTMYAMKAPQCAAERRLRNRGMCIVKREVNAYKSCQPNVKVSSQTTYANGRTLVRTFYETPVGTLSSLHEPAGFTSWRHERLFKTPDDYKALLFMIQDERYTPNYAAFAQAEKDFGEDGIFRAGFNLEPLQTLISGPYMDMQTFCFEWMDRRDEILKLYAAIVEQRRAVYRLVAESPAGHANYGGNVTPQIVSPEIFEEYYLPHYAEAAEIMHRHGKLIGSHLDANCGSLAHLIARAPLDYIEAFTPAPDTDMTLGAARAAWPDKVLWINFPSSVHLRPDAAVADFTVDMLNELSAADGLICGITEDIPPERWQGSCTAIMDGLDRHAREFPGRYA